MRALDTNVLCRFFVNDAEDPEALRQRPAAVAALSQRAFVPATVMLELEWVLRGFYLLPRKQIVRVFDALVGIEHVTVEDRPAVLAAIDGYRGGLDFADAMHLARSARCTALATFDRRLVRRAGRLGAQPAVELLG